MYIFSEKYRWIQLNMWYNHSQRSTRGRVVDISDKYYWTITQNTLTMGIKHNNFPPTNMCYFSKSNKMMNWDNLHKEIHMLYIYFLHYWNIGYNIFLDIIMGINYCIVNPLNMKYIYISFISRIYMDNGIFHRYWLLCCENSRLYRYNCFSICLCRYSKYKLSRMTNICFLQ